MFGVYPTEYVVATHDWTGLVSPETGEAKLRMRFATDSSGIYKGLLVSPEPGNTGIKPEVWGSGYGLPTCRRGGVANPFDVTGVTSAISAPNPVGNAQALAGSPYSRIDGKVTFVNNTAPAPTYGETQRLRPMNCTSRRYQTPGRTDVNDWLDQSTGPATGGNNEFSVLLKLTSNFKR